MLYSHYNIKKGGTDLIVTLFGIEISMTVVWLAAALIFLGVEAITVGLATIWFAAGAVAALILAFIDVPVPVQVVVFLVVSIVLLVSTRKIFIEKLNAGKEKTNVDALIDAAAVVIKPILPYEVGQVKVSGQVWSAIGKNPEDTYAEGQLVKIISVEGVKLVVTSANSQNNQSILN